ncbi:SETMR methyltransferase, partial [Acromyrmex charruanus]
MEQRSAIKFCVRNGISAAETLRMCQKAYGDGALSQARVFAWHRMFKEGRESVQDEPRAGRPSTSTDVIHVQKIRDLVLANRRLTVRDLTDLVGISEGSVKTILSDHLGLPKKCSRNSTEVGQIWFITVATVALEDRRTVNTDWYTTICAKLEIHSKDCEKLNDYAIRIPSKDDKWLSFDILCRKERVLFVVYADRSDCLVDQGINSLDAACHEIAYLHSNDLAERHKVSRKPHNIGSLLEISSNRVLEPRQWHESDIDRNRNIGITRSIKNYVSMTYEALITLNAGWNSRSDRGRILYFLRAPQHAVGLS